MQEAAAELQGWQGVGPSAHNLSEQRRGSSCCRGSSLAIGRLRSGGSIVVSPPSGWLVPSARYSTPGKANPPPANVFVLEQKQLACSKEGGKGRRGSAGDNRGEDERLTHRNADTGGRPVRWGSL